MQSKELVSGFSELKDLLIRTYKIDKPRELVRLYFSIERDMLIMHEYDDHKKIIILSVSSSSRKPSENLAPTAARLVANALKNPKPAQFLIDHFQLYGFFRF